MQFIMSKINSKYLLAQWELHGYLVVFALKLQRVVAYNTIIVGSAFLEFTGIKTRCELFRCTAQTSGVSLIRKKYT